MVYRIPIIPTTNTTTTSGGGGGCGENENGNENSNNNNNDNNEDSENDTNPATYTAPAPAAKVIDFHTFRQMNGNLGMDDPGLYLKILAQKKRWSFDYPTDKEFVFEQASRET